MKFHAVFPARNTVARHFPAINTCVGKTLVVEVNAGVPAAEYLRPNFLKKFSFIHIFFVLCAVGDSTVNNLFNLVFLRHMFQVIHSLREGHIQM